MRVFYFGHLSVTHICDLNTQILQSSLAHPYRAWRYGHTAHVGIMQHPTRPRRRFANALISLVAHLLCGYCPLETVRRIYHDRVCFKMWDREAVVRKVDI